MKKEIKAINFENKTLSRSHFDFVHLEDILNSTPKNHNQFEFHKVSFYILFLVTKNEGTYSLNFKDYPLKKGTIFTLRKDNIHKFHKNKSKGILLIFTENFIVNHSSKLEASKLILLFNEMLTSPKLQLNEIEYKEIITLTNLIKEEYFKRKDDYAPNIIRNLLQVIANKLLRIKSKDNQILDHGKYLSNFLTLQKLVENHCFNSKKVSFYADKMGVTSKTLNNITQSIIHQSAKAFINDTVIIQTKRLIINSQDSLTEIAFQVGFDEPTNFFKYFRKYTGVSPSQFRTMHQNG